MLFLVRTRDVIGVNQQLFLQLSFGELSIQYKLLSNSLYTSLLKPVEWLFFS